MKRKQHTFSFNFAMEAPYLSLIVVVLSAVAIVLLRHFERSITGSTATDTFIWVYGLIAIQVLLLHVGIMSDKASFIFGIGGIFGVIILYIILFFSSLAADTAVVWTIVTTILYAISLILGLLQQLYGRSRRN